MSTELDRLVLLRWRLKMCVVGVLICKLLFRCLVFCFKGVPCKVQRIPTTSYPQSRHTCAHAGYIITLYASQGIKHISRHSLSTPSHLARTASEKILVTRDAVLIQPCGDPVSSGLLLPWLHHSYLSGISQSELLLLRVTHTISGCVSGKCCCRPVGSDV